MCNNNNIKYERGQHNNNNNIITTIIDRKSIRGTCRENNVCFYNMTVARSRPRFVGRIIFNEKKKNTQKKNSRSMTVINDITVYYIKLRA